MKNMRRAVLFLLASCAVALPALATGPLWWSGSGCSTSYDETTAQPCQPGTAVKLWYDEYGLSGPISWNFGDGSPVVAADAAAAQYHTWPVPGVYPVSVSVGGTVHETWHLRIGYATLAFSGNSAVATEGGSAVVTVQRSRTGTAGSVAFQTKSGTAAAGTRFVATSGTVDFSASDGSRTITIPLIDDARFDDPQTFEIDIISPSAGFFIATPDKIMVTIKDNDPPPSFAMAAPEYRPRETDGSFNATIMRSGDMLRRVNVNWSAGGTAVPAKTGTVTFDPGETSKTISIAVANDDIYTGREEGQFRITSADASGVAINPTFAMIYVEEDEPVPTVSIGDGSAIEGGECVMPVTFSGKVAEAQVDFYVNGISAASDDFRDSITRLYFGPASTTAMIHLPTVADTRVERNETVKVSPSTYPFKTARDGTCTIVDDDTQLLPEVLSLHEGVPGKLTLAWGEPLTAATTVNILTTGVVSAPATLTAQPNTTTLQIPVTATDHGSVTATLQRAGVPMRPATASVRTVSGATPVLDPQQLSLRSGATAAVTVSIVPPQNGNSDVAITSADMSVAAVPQLVTVPAGGTAQFQLNGLAPGQTTITATLLGGASVSMPVEVTLASRPEIASVSPASGSPSGGTRITISGDGFDAGCTVMIGFYAATDVVVSNAQTLGATTPPHEAGAVPVIVNCGPYEATLPDGFTYLVPRRRPAR